jgi:DNA-binding GntR family transcriptional regulator
MTRSAQIDPVIVSEDEGLSLAERAYRQLRDEIVTLALRPGDVIDERQLQAHLNVGRTPIREALLRLAGDRLVTIHARRGTFVSDMNLTDLRSVFEVREPLEALAARLAAVRATEDERAAVAAVRAGLADEVSAADLDGLMELDRRLHRLVYQLTRNGFLIETLERYLNHSTRLSRGAVERAGDPWPGWLADAVLSLDPLLRAIQERRPEEAAAAAAAHAASTEAHVRDSV